MRKEIFALNLTTLMVLFCHAPILAIGAAEEIGQLETQPTKHCEAKHCSRHRVGGVEHKKTLSVAEKSKEVVRNVKEGIEKKAYEHRMKAAHDAKAKAEKKANDLLAESEETAQNAQDAAQRAKQIAELIEDEQKAIAQHEETRDPNYVVYEDNAQKKYEHYLKAAARAKEKAEKEAFDYNMQSKKAAQRAREAAQTASMIAKHIEVEEKAHTLHERFKTASETNHN